MGRRENGVVVDHTASHQSRGRPVLCGLGRAIFSGIVSGLVTVVASVSLAALIFSGGISTYLAYGVTISLISAAIVGLVVSLAGSCSVAIAIPQDRTAPILAVMAASIAAAAPVHASSDQVLLSIALAMAITTLITGAFLLVLGLARAGGLMRFIPYSVLSGVLAGTGWLLVLGGVEVMTGQELNMAADLSFLFDGEQRLRWLPGVGVAVAIIFASRYLSYGIALPVILLAATGLFYLVALSAGETLGTLAQSAWLLGPLDMAAIGPGALGISRLVDGADWNMLVANWANIATILVVSAISILLTVSALELLSGEESDVNRELRVAGLANITAGLGGGIVGFHSLSVSSLALKLGGRGRLPGVVAALTCGVALVAGANAIGLLPRLVAGALLVSLGLSFLVEWLLGSFKRLPLAEYLLVPLIVAIIATLGFVPGVLAGLIAAVLIFVVSYSRTQVIRHALTGAEITSSVERSLDDQRCLRRYGGQIQILKLSGYLFFGTATQVLTKVKERADGSGEAPLACVLIDFAHINGVDSSAAYAFTRLQQLASRRDFLMALTGMRPDHARRMRLGQQPDDGGHVRLFSDLDHGLEWCESQLLTDLAHGQPHAATTMLQRLSELLPHDQGDSPFLDYLSEVWFEGGETLITQGDASNDLFFLDSGEVSVFLRRANGTTLRIRRTGAGAMLGELGFYLNLPRTASVIADHPGKAFRLTVAALTRMESERPELAATLHRFMANLLAERLANTTQTLQRILD